MTINGISYSSPKAINLRGSSSVKGSALRFGRTSSSNPFDSTSDGLYTNTSNQLIFSSQGTTTVIGAAGGGGTPTWETIFAADATMTITPDTAFTIAGNRSTATNVVLMTNVAGGSGAILAFTNSTATNNDILGTASTWAVTGEGAATFLNLVLTGTTITSTTGDIAWALRDNRSAALSIGASGDTNIMVIDTSNAAPLVVFNDGISMTDGNATFISTSNTVTNVLVTNNTLTTFGANASSAGMVCLRSTSLTTGSLLQLQLSDTANAGGFYLTCRESVGGTNDFTIGENGVVVLAGTASTTSFTMSLGNLVLTDGTIGVTSTGTADVVSVTANSILTNNALIVQGSGTFTGTTTGAFVYISPTGLTSGTALGVTAVLADTSVGVVDIATAGLTSGTALRITTATAAFTTGGKMIELTSAAAVAGNHLTATTTGAYTGTGMILVTAGAATTGILVSLVSTTGLTSGSLLRATTSTAGALATNGAISLSATGAFTSTSATDGGFVEVKANTTTAGTVVNVVATGLTTGVGLILSNGTSAMTTGSLLRVDASGTGAIATNGLVSLTHAGVFTSTSSTNGGFVEVKANSTTAGTIVNVVGSGLTTGIMLSMSNGTSAMTTGSLIRLAASGTGAIATNGIVSLKHAGIFTSTSATDGGFVEIAANATTAGTIINVLGTGLITGIGMHISNGTAATTTEK